MGGRTKTKRALPDEGKEETTPAEQIKLIQEITDLIEQGFQFVCESDGFKFFKKPK